MHFLFVYDFILAPELPTKFRLQANKCKSMQLLSDKTKIEAMYIVKHYFIIPNTYKCISKARRNVRNLIDVVANLLVANQDYRINLATTHR